MVKSTFGVGVAVHDHLDRDFCRRLMFTFRSICTSTEIVRRDEVGGQLLRKQLLLRWRSGC